VRAGAVGGAALDACGGCAVHGFVFVTLPSGVLEWPVVYWSGAQASCAFWDREWRGR
jgi:hypothetical protein